MTAPDQTIAERRDRARVKAWRTRRAKYGPKGHHAYAYTSHRDGRCPDCTRMRTYLARLYAEGVLSEGQAAKVSGLDRVALRKLADEQGGAR